MIVFLDSGVLGILSSPYQDGEARECSEWLYRLLSRSVYVVSSDICDYEVRRGLKLALLSRPVKSGLRQLDALTNVIDFLPLTRDVMEIASDLWAQARSQGKATANDKNIDGDMIIAAHWSILSAKYPGREVVVVTTNFIVTRSFDRQRYWNRFRKSENLVLYASVPILVVVA